MIKRYVWKELSEDGLLKEPRPKYENGCEVDLNGYRGVFETEREALNAFETFFYDYPCQGNFVLITLYDKDRD